MTAVGDIFAVPLRKGLWGAGRVLSVEGGHAFVVLDGFWTAPPTAKDVRGRPVMAMPFGQGGGPHEDVFKGWFQGAWPRRFPVVVHVPLSAAERALGSPEGTHVYQSPEHFARHLHEHWRWLFERAALESEWAHAGARAAARARARERLTLAQMARQRPCARWSDRWPRAVVAEANRIFRDATRELLGLADGARRAPCAAVLRRIVDEFNALDDRTGCVESVERDQIVERIEALAARVGLTNTGEKLTGHRHW